MKNQNDEELIREVIEGFAGSLNKGDAALLPSFFSEDGKFMPEGIRTIDDPKKLIKIGERNLSKIQFQIQFNLEEITLEGNFAFITATASTSQVAGEGKLSVSKSSRDFFVLKYNGSDWKIYRYMFNNVS